MLPELPLSEVVEQIPGQGIFVFPGETTDDPNHLPDLESYSGRYRLTRFTSGDIDWLVEILQDSSVWQQGYLGVDPLPTIAAQIEQMVHLRHVDALGYAIRTSLGELIGALRIERDIEAGWARIADPVFESSAWSIDTTIEVNATLLDWLFDEGFERVETTVDPRNAPVVDTLARGGFTDEGVRRHAVQRHDGVWLDRRYLSVLRGEWGSSLRKSVLVGLTIRWERDLRNSGVIPSPRAEGQPEPETERAPSLQPLELVQRPGEKQGSSWFGWKRKAGS